jgi:hypothetical protein
MAITGLSTAPVFATYFSPSGPEKGHRNANMRIFFSDGSREKERITAWQKPLSMKP